MINDMLRRTLNAAGLHVYGSGRGTQPWSHTVEDYYPVDARSRWVAGERPIPQLTAALNSQRTNYVEFLDMMEATRALLHRVPHRQPPGDSASPYWSNSWFTALDGAALITLLASKRPRTYLEIGSGNSTAFANFTRKTLGLATQIWSIDPTPRREIDAICDRMIRTGLENCDLTLFDTVEPGDVVFYDGSHRVFSNSDVTVFFFEVLPRLKPGVFVHVHDIFLPFDYPQEWNGRLYNEQYLLAAMLMCEKRPFSLVAPAAFMCADPELGARVKAIFKASSGPAIPFNYPTGAKLPGSSFWIRTSDPRNARSTH